jgi:hypothetical protein
MEHDNTISVLFSKHLTCSVTGFRCLLTTTYNLIVYSTIVPRFLTSYHKFMFFP